MRSKMKDSFGNAEIPCGLRLTRGAIFFILMQRNGDLRDLKNKYSQKQRKCFHFLPLLVQQQHQPSTTPTLFCNPKLVFSAAHFSLSLFSSVSFCLFFFFPSILATAVGVFACICFQKTCNWFNRGVCFLSRYLSS